MAKTPATPLDQARISQIAQTIRGTVAPFTRTPRKLQPSQHSPKSARVSNSWSRWLICPSGASGLKLR